jgi:replicative DNA helicase
MSTGLGLLRSLILEDRTILSLGDDFSLSRSSFNDSDIKVYDFIYSYFISYGKMPTTKTVEVECDVSFAKLVDEPPLYWANSLKKQNTIAAVLSSSGRQKSAAVRGDAEAAIDEARKLVSEYDAIHEADRLLQVGTLSDVVLEQHDKRQVSSVLSGIPFGFPFLDEITDGAQASDTVAVVGQVGIGKSYFMLQCALNAYKAGYTPLILPMEMSAIQCTRRMVALHSGVPSTYIRLGKLSYWGREKMIAGIQGIKDFEQPFYIIQGSLKSTIESVGARIQEIKPSVVYIDGGYLLRSSSQKDGVRWERIAYTAEVIKIMAKEFNMPFVVSYQFSKGGKELDDIGGSIAISQLASIVCTLRNENAVSTYEDWSPVSYKILELKKGREGESGAIRVKYDMDRMIIEQTEVLSKREMAGDS